MCSAKELVSKSRVTNCAWSPFLFNQYSKAFSYISFSSGINQRSFQQFVLDGLCCSGTAGNAVPGEWSTFPSCLLSYALPPVAGIASLLLCGAALSAWSRGWRQSSTATAPSS
jgi:hypothetical protein